MASHSSSSLFRTRLVKPILQTDTPPFTMRVSGTTNMVSNGYLTVSPGTENEEIMEYTTFDSVNKTVNVITRGINPGVTPKSNSTTYYKPHFYNDEVRGDVNHLHLYEAERGMLDTDNTFSGKNIFTGEVEVTTNMGIPTFANTSARNAAIPSPEGDEICKVNGVFQWYDAVLATWQSAGSSTPVPTATESNLGVSRTATAAQVTANTNDDSLFVTPYKLGQKLTGYALAANGSITGEIKMWPTTSAPSGWFICDGTAVSRTTYSALFAVVGTTFGVGDGSTTFNLPDMRGRVAVGKNAGTFSSIGGVGGEETHTLTVPEIPSHSHNIQYYSSPGSNSVPQTYLSNLAGSPTNMATTSTGGGGAHNNLQPYLVLNYIIKT